MSNKLKHRDITESVLGNIRWDIDSQSIRNIIDFLTKVGEELGFDCTLDIQVYEDCAELRVERKRLETDEELAARQRQLDDREHAQYARDLLAWERVQARNLKT
jgi:hypothetical protein